MARLGRRPLFKPDGQPAGSVEAMTVGAAAALAGVGLVEDNWPWDLDPSVRQQWLDQQRELAYVVSEVLAGEPWQPPRSRSAAAAALPLPRVPVRLGDGRGADRLLPGRVRTRHSAYSLAFVRVDPKLYVERGGPRWITPSGADPAMTGRQFSG